MSEGGEANGTVSGENSPRGTGTPKRNPQRNRRPPKRLSYEAHVMKSESDQERRDRGWKLWQRVRAKRAVGHM